MQNFNYYIPTKVYFGKGQIGALGEELKNRAKKVLIVTGGGSVKKNGIFDQVIKEAKKARVSFVELSGVKPNPRLKSVYEGIEIARKEGVDFILAVGGGSVIDASKAIAGGAEYKGDVWDFFTKGVACTEAIPLGTVLTLAATGSEMNTFAVITKEDAERKLAFGSEAVRPVFSILDPEYTYTVHKYHTASGVADIMAHIFEEYFSGPLSAAVEDRLAEALLKVCIRYGPEACRKPKDYEAIENPVLSPEEGTYGDVSSNPLAPFIVRLWRTLVVVGGLALLLFLIWGAIDWMMSEGDQEKLKNAKNKILHALAGMGILAASYAMVKLTKHIFGFDILEFEWPTPGG